MKRFLKWTIIIVGIFAFFLFIAYLFIDALLDTEPIVYRTSFLHINLGGSIPEYEAPEALDEYIRGIPVDMKKIRDSFRMAAVDERIKGVILKLGYLSAGFAKLAELQKIIHNFRSSGKLVLAHLDYGLTRGYLLATACDSIYMSPAGNLFLTGLSAEVSFYRDLLKKVGVEADFEHVGEYKNAPDVYTRQTMSENQQQVINDILDARYKELIATIAHNRRLTKKQVEHFIENVSGFSPEEAVNVHLIDGIKYVDDLESILQGNSKHISEISASQYSRIDPETLGFSADERIAVIHCLGTMVGGEDGMDPVFGKTVGANRVVRDLERAAASSSIKAIVLRINSPGGSSMAADKMWHAVIKAREEKPIVASISDVGASGGYYVALGADTIISQPLSLVGSIGVYIGKFSLNRLYQKLDINNVVIKRGQNASLFSLSSKFSDSERLIIRRMLNDFYKKFVSLVAESRGVSYEEIDHVARGRVWDGSDGRLHNLIDMYGGMAEAIAVARKLARIDSTEGVRLIHFPRSRSLIDQIFNRFTIIKAVFENPVSRLEKYLVEFQAHPLFLMPFALHD